MNRINGMMGEHVLCENGFEVIRIKKERNPMNENDMEDELLDGLIEVLKKHNEEKKEKEEE